MLAIFALVLVAFIVTGIGDPFGGGPAPTTVAEVGGHDITTTTLTDQFDRQMQALRQETPALTNEEAVRGGAIEGVLERLIGAEALALMGDELGLTVSKRQVDAEIVSFPAFRGPDGRFSETAFRQVLAAQRLDEAALRDEIGGDLVRQQLLATVEDLSLTPKTLVKPYADLQLESRKVVIGAVPAQSFEVDAPTDADIAAYYKSNIARFTMPERRRITYALIERDKVASGIEVSDQAIKDYYDKHPETYGSREERALSQVVVPSKADADKLIGLVKDGKTFAEAAKEVANYAPEDLALGSQTEKGLAETISKDVATAAFAAEQGELTPPVESSFGWHVLRVDAINTKPAQPLAEVKDEIAALLRTEMTEDKVAEVVAKADDELAEGANINEVAKDLGLEVQTLPALTKDGQTLEKTDLKLDERLRPLIELGFKYDPDESAAVEELSPSLYAVIDVEAAIPPTPVPLEQVKTQAAAALTFERQMEAASKAADEIVSAVKSGKSLADELAGRKLPKPQTLEARRVQLAAEARQRPIPAPITLGFALPEGSVQAIPQPQQAAVYIVDVEEVTPGNSDESPPFVSSLQSQLHQAAPSEWAQSLVGAIVHEVGVERNPKAINTLKQRYLGGPDTQ
jgi:parvulin-like peptidyl-prolyl isomerase